MLPERFQKLSYDEKCHGHGENRSILCLLIGSIYYNSLSAQLGPDKAIKSIT